MGHSADHLWVHAAGTWLRSLLQWVDHLRIVQHIKDDLHVVFPNILLLDDVLDLEGVDAHVLGLVDQCLFQHRLVQVQLLVRVHLLPQTQLSLDLLSLLLLGWSRLNIALLEVVSQLVRYLLKGLLRELELVTTELSERYKLNDVSAHIPFVLVRVKRSHVGIQLVHRRKISITDSDDHNTQRVVGAPNNLVDGLLEVIDDAIGDDEQDLVALVVV